MGPLEVALLCDQWGTVDCDRQAFMLFYFYFYLFTFKIGGFLSLYTATFVYYMFPDYQGGQTWNFKFEQVVGVNIPFCFFPSASLLIRNVVIATNDRMTLLSGKTPEENPAPSSFSVFSSVNSMIGYLV